MRIASLALALIVALALPVLPAPPVRADNSPFVGLWSTTLYQADGKAFTSIWMKFDANGVFTETMLVPAGQANYYGTWSSDGETLTTIINRVEPDYAAQLIQIGAPYTSHIAFSNGGNSLSIEQQGTVPLNMTRQPG